MAGAAVLGTGRAAPAAPAGRRRVERPAASQRGLAQPVGAVQRAALAGAAHAGGLPHDAAGGGPPRAPPASRTMRRVFARRARLGTSLPFALRVEGRLAGQVTLDNIVRGALRSGYLGYWIDRSVAGRGMASLAVALVCDHGFSEVGLHRIEADIRPENLPSRRLVERLAFRREGLLRRYLDIDGDWRDHFSYALLAEDLPGGVLAH